VEAQKMRGFILDKNVGFDGQRVVSIATLKTSNTKTGNLIQVWILKEDQNPLEVLKLGADVSICGDCKHRNSSCYVNVGQAPAQVWKSYKRGIYKDFFELTEKDKNALVGRKVRFGAYGDPVLIRVKQIKALLDLTKSTFTGYTHAWNNPVFQDYKAFFMASVDSKKEYIKAIGKAWKTFRVRKEFEALEKNEFVCPASAEAGKRKTCFECMACSGTRKGKGTPAIVAHGSTANKFSN
jgi:hypothetical protein